MVHILSSFGVVDKDRKRKLRLRRPQRKIFFVRSGDLGGCLQNSYANNKFVGPSCTYTITVVEHLRDLHFHMNLTLKCLFVAREPFCDFEDVITYGLNVQ